MPHALGIRPGDLEHVAPEHALVGRLQLLRRHQRPTPATMRTLLLAHALQLALLDCRVDQLRVLERRFSVALLHQALAVVLASACSSASCRLHRPLGLFLALLLLHHHQLRRTSPGSLALHC